MLTETEINAYNTRAALLRQLSALSGIPKSRWTRLTDEQLEGNIRGLLKKAAVTKQIRQDRADLGLPLD